jgi:hypothetical protein
VRDDSARADRPLSATGADGPGGSAGGGYHCDLSGRDPTRAAEGYTLGSFSDILRLLPLKKELIMPSKKEEVALSERVTADYQRG